MWKVERGLLLRSGRIGERLQGVTPVTRDLPRYVLWLPQVYNANHVRRRSSRGSLNSSSKMASPRKTSYGRTMIEKQNSDNKYEVDELSIGCLVKMELVRPVRYPSDHRNNADK